MISYWFIDLIIVGFILFFTLRGLRRGLIMAVAGAVTMITALVGAYFAASVFSHPIERIVETPVSNWVATRMENIDTNIIGDVIPTLDAHKFDALRTLGFNENLVPLISNAISNQIDQAATTFQAAITSVLVTAIAHILTYIIAFIVIFVALTLAARLLDTIAKLPVLNTANKIGGLAGGLLQGVLLVWLVVYVLRFVGLIGENIVNGTFLLRFFG
jgi:uncharacterized membrane protein required for colicin V production